MIDWVNVFVAALWIAGLAFLLALLSLARSSREQSTRQVLSQPAFRVGTAGGIALVALGMFLSIEVAWEQPGWAIVIVLSLWEGVAAWQSGCASKRRV